MVKTDISNTTKKLYKKLKNILIIQALLCLSATTILLTILLAKYYFISVFLLLLFIPWHRVHCLEINCITEIAKEMVTADFEQNDFKNKTLYQIGNFYGKKYNIPSIVDSIYNSEQILHSVLFILTILIIIFPGNITALIIFTIMLFYISSRVLRTYEKSLGE